MMKVYAEDDCGNAPKKAQLRDFNIAYAQGDVPHLLQNVADGIRWTIVGDRVIEGKVIFAQAVAQMAQTPVIELTISYVLTHGNIGAVNGTRVLEDGSQYDYCDVYRFASSAKNATIKEITTYLIKTK